MELWRASLTRLLDRYDRARGLVFFPWLILFFVIVNLACYWLAMFTAFPHLCRGSRGIYYFKCQFPVGILGAVFDCVSFFVTVFMVRRALTTTRTRGYLACLSVDGLLAILGTFWVLFVFISSGWIIHALDGTSSPLDVRGERYADHALSALENPFANLRNIYFGIVMGISATLPTAVHVFLSFKSAATAWLLRLSALPGPPPADGELSV
jgi:hypothetical protein